MSPWKVRLVTGNPSLTCWKAIWRCSLSMPSTCASVPGRKTDVKDAEWIADLLQHGLLRPSFVPPAPQRELRELTRYRISLSEERSRLINRLRDVAGRCQHQAGLGRQ